MKKNQLSFKAIPINSERWSWSDVRQ